MRQGPENLIDSFQKGTTYSLLVFLGQTHKVIHKDIHISGRGSNSWKRWVAVGIRLKWGR